MSPRILLADDDLEFTKLLKTSLTKENITVESTHEGMTALTMIKKGGYDLILLDILMPDLNGITLLKNLQPYNPESPNGPIIMITALDEEEFVHSCLELGATGYINKATTQLPELIQQIKTFLTPAENNN